jgi:hypothetical protein
MPLVDSPSRMIFNNLFDISLLNYLPYRFAPPLTVLSLSMPWTCRPCISADVVYI